MENYKKQIEDLKIQARMINDNISQLEQSIDKNFIRPEEKKEEVKEKEYTILSFTDGNVILERNHVGNYVHFGPNEAKAASLKLALEAYKIHSVRRDSDGEVFTLGDSIFAISDKDEKIKKFKIENNDLWIDHCFGLSKIQGIQKAPIRKPILVTEDGVEIFEGDKYWSVIGFDAPTFDSADYPWELDKRIHKTFSTKEKAEEYIKWNKPMYSLNDVSWATYGNQEALEMILGLDRR